MNSPVRATMEADSVRFFSQCDESAFFEWLDKLPFVDGYEGRGLTLYITVNMLDIDEGGLRELLALFWRYGLEMRQLALFNRDEFSDWFCDSRAYWYKNVFG